MPTEKKSSGPSKKAVTHKKKAKGGKEDRPLYVVGVGASAGGLEALEQLFDAMPPATGMAFVVVSHLDPTHTSIMPELIRKHAGEMRVQQVGDGMRVSPDTVYLIPPNKDMAIMNGVLCLMEPTGQRGRRLPIDYFFRSLAVDRKDEAIGIILSGTGTDGTLGLKAVKGELGLTMAQDPQSAKYDGMPRSAISTGLVDYVAPPKEMPNYLVSYVKHARTTPADDRLPVEDEPHETLRKILLLLRNHTGHDFSFYKKNTLLRRLERRKNLHRIENFAQYIRYLQQNPHEMDTLFKELLIGVTNFFRDPDAFEALKKKAFPHLFEGKSDDHGLRVWVPGCSTGEEAYSLGIVLREAMEERGVSLSAQIFGTDLDPDAIDTARAGIYPDSISADVSPSRLKRFFTRGQNSYRINRDIREMLVFAPQSIIKDPPFTRMDLVCCRNLLIYLEQDLQKRVLPLFHYTLNPGGILFLGSSETIGGFLDLFSALDKKWKIFRRKESPAGRLPADAFPLFPQHNRVPRTQSVKASCQGTEQVGCQQFEKVLLERYVPPSVITDQNGQIVYVHGRTGRYLEPAPGEASLSIVDMAREGLRFELMSALRKASCQDKDIVCKSLRVRSNGHCHVINLVVHPLREPETMRGLLMVVFEEGGAPESPDAPLVVDSHDVTDRKVKELEQELMYSRENLQSTIEELETANEELKSTNEELQSTNEELQSTNEEMETSKEELQSLNEELVTVNAELQSKNDELMTSNNDMKNLLDSTQVPTVFLDSRLCIKRFTSRAVEVFNLIEGDVGRPLGHLVSKLKSADLMENAQEVLNKLIPIEKEVETLDGHWFLMRVLPYRTIDDVIDGVVVAFLDIHEQKEMAERLEKLNTVVVEARTMYENIVQTVREPLVVLDSDFRVVLVNRSFCSTFRVTRDETQGMSIFELGGGQWNVPALRGLLENIHEKNEAFEDFEVDHVFPLTGRRKMILNARKVPSAQDGDHLILLAMEEVPKTD